MAHLLSVFVNELGLTLNLEPVSTKINEIPGTSKLLLRMPPRCWAVVLDALVTQEARSWARWGLHDACEGEPARSPASVAGGVLVTAPPSLALRNCGIL